MNRFASEFMILDFILYNFAQHVIVVLKRLMKMTIKFGTHVEPSYQKIKSKIPNSLVDQFILSHTV